MTDLINGDYAALLHDIKDRIRSAQYQALKAVNKELISLYWDIGRQIVDRQRAANWGQSVVEKLASDIRAEFPGIQGFSAANLWRVRSFYEAYAGNEKLAPLVREIGWSHNLAILEKCKDDLEREFYLRMTRAYGWTKNVLTHQIENQTYQKTQLNQTNFAQTLPEPTRTQANLAVKDEYTFDFLELGDEYSERQLETAILARVEPFLQQMGGAFTFVGSQYRLAVGSKEYFIDLLLYHRRLKCLVALELKIGEFEPEHVGKMQFYLAVLDDTMKMPDENPAIGIILCKSKERTTVEYALRESNKPIGVATYQFVTSLPAELQDELPSPEQIARLFGSDTRMSITGTASMQDDQARKALEAFITDNPELERLEALLAQFNIFEAIGAVRHEVRHSDFLAYLLTPQENHGLEDNFIKALLQGVLASETETDSPMTPADLASSDLKAATVQREWQRMDIFLRDERHQFSVIIENKIDTGEHDDQLARYYEKVQREFPNDRIIALYLTKEGEEPSDERYLPIGYGVVCEAVENVVERCDSTLGRDVHTLMMHYAQMLRRHIMSDTEIAHLCGQIYQKHKAALDLIYEHRPNRQGELILFLQSLLEAQPNLGVGPISEKGRWIGFSIPEWPSFLYFVFESSPIGLILWMTIGPTDLDIRRQLFEFASNHQPPFRLKQRSLSSRNSRIFSRTFLTATDYEDAETQKLEDKIIRQWEQFLQQDLPPIRKVLAAGGWLDGVKAGE